MTKYRLAIVVVVSLFLATAVVAQEPLTPSTQELPAAKGPCSPPPGGKVAWFDTCVYLTPGYGVTIGRRISGGEPQYTDAGRRAKINGTVLLAVAVNATGSVDAVKVVRRLEPSLDQSAITTVKTWKFSPATKDGAPVAVQFEVEATFNLY